MSIFEQATKLKLRFATNKGNISVEDLWDLPLTSTRHMSLDALARALNREVKETQEESFVIKAAATNSIAVLKFDIVKHVIGVRLAENEVKLKAAETKQRNARILALIGEKQDDALKGKTIEELEALLSA